MWMPAGLDQWLNVCAGGDEPAVSAGVHGPKSRAHILPGRHAATPALHGGF